MSNELQSLIDNAGRIVFFGGAGVSTESGIPDFRSVDGLYNQKYDHPPETILSHTYFKYYTEEFFRFYRDKMLYLDAKPNDAHIKLARLEKAGKLLAVVTQNIDGLHQMAGSKTVYELHGSVHRNHCTRCKRAYGVEAIAQSTGVPRCSFCGGIIKPDVVLYEESLPERALSHAISAIRAADLLIIGGTSMTVYPAAGLIEHFRRGKIVLINRDPTAYDGRADLIIRDRIGQVFSKIEIR
ncbi:MAG: NAD-dependent protein deacylase [Clostridiales bacterium]|nr:NAD-dependent protein deacylase [Clostridiales bacterium]MBQ2818357.1 NAD-dependent protein deacylase [Clostridia bacterium]